jgi:hypothetical protein
LEIRTKDLEIASDPPGEFEPKINRYSIFFLFSGLKFASISLLLFLKPSVIALIYPLDDSVLELQSSQFDDEDSFRISENCEAKPP